MTFFKPEDFKKPSHYYLDWLTAYVKMVDIANAKLEKHGRVVYLDEDPARYVSSDARYGCSTFQDKEHTHKALLISIEPLKKCTHPEEKVESYYLEACRPETKYFKCECGAKLRIKSFEEIV